MHLCLRSEQPAIRSDADRLSLATLYLHFFYNDPMVLDKENLDAFVGAHRKTSVGLAPSVTTKTDGTFDIELVQKGSKYGSANISSTGSTTKAEVSWSAAHASPEERYEDLCQANGRLFLTIRKSQ